MVMRYNIHVSTYVIAHYKYSNNYKAVIVLFPKNQKLDLRNRYREIPQI